MRLVIVFGLAVVAAGCGGKTAAPGVAQVTSTAAATTEIQGGPATAASPMRYARCMRSHGVPRFPDLTAGFGDEEIVAPSGVDTHSPQFRAAQRACANRLPGGGPVQTDADLAAERQAVGQALLFAACMRAHGLPSFPDPAPVSDGGGIRLPKGLDPRAPQFQAARTACASLDGKTPKNGTSSRGEGGR